MNEVEQLIVNALENQSSIVIAIDGNAGSGKTTLASSLAERYPVDVISMDDFFLPFEMKTPERLKQPGENVHWIRFIIEVAPHLRQTYSWTYNAYNCQTKQLSSKKLEGHPIKIVEGVYSCHPQLQHLYDYKIGLHITPELQKTRIIQRSNLDMWHKFETMWIPLENSYFTHYNIFDKCDVVMEVK